MYILETCKAGRTIEVRKMCVWGKRERGARRKKKQKPSTEEQLAANLKNAIRKLTRIMNTNFGAEDYHLVLSYRKEEKPDSWEGMARDAREFLKKLRKEYKKLGLPWGYVRVMECGKRGARHHHLVIKGIKPAIFRKCWTKGWVGCYPLDESGQYKDLAAYFLKFTDEAVRAGILKHRWDSSKNLKQPEIHRVRVSRRYFRATPKIEKGYYLDKDTVQEYVDANGNRQFSYTLIKIRGDTS